MAGMLIKKRLMYYSLGLNTEGAVSVLLISTSQTYLEQLGKDLYITREIQKDERPYTLRVHTCKSVQDVLCYMTDEFHVDFIVFVLDAGLGNCLLEVKDNLSYIDPSFPREKICLANPESTYIKTMVSPFEIWEFAREYQLNLINGNIKKPNGLFNFSKQILNVIEVGCGLHSGVPLVNYV